ncbi:MAG: hypothetical protein GY800_08270 [Planctomycetes bacterium]|nr:hypothetical protein [Planctomycetota bacterium]
MNRRTIILLAVLGLLFPIAIYRVYSSIWGGSSRPASTTSYRAPAPVTLPVPADSAEEEGEEAGKKARPFHPVKVDTASFKRLVASGEWGRNPFLTLDELYQPKQKKKATKKTVTKELAPQDLILSSILMSGKDGVALINGEFYMVGDVLPTTKETIAAITKDGVVLEGAKGRKLLSIAQSDIPLTSREE